MRASRIISVTGMLIFTCKVLAHDGTVNISGNILAASCDVEQTSSNQQVYIGDFPASTFMNVGDTSSSKPFSIEITGCSDNIKGGQVMFSGNSDLDDPALLALIDTAGTNQIAKGVGIEIMDSEKRVISINSDSELYSLSPGDNVLSFYLRYKSTKSSVTAGKASSIMYFDLKYQ